MKIKNKYSVLKLSSALSLVVLLTCSTSMAMFTVTDEQKGPKRDEKSTLGPSKTQSTLSVFLPAETARLILDELSDVLKGSLNATETRIQLEKILTRFPSFTARQRNMLYQIALNWNQKIDRSKVPSAADPSSMNPTSNSMGVELAKSTPFHKAFWSSIKPGDQILDIGCAFGFNTTMALIQGATVFAMDIEPAHLAILLRNTKPKFLAHLQVYLGSFPDDLELKDYSIQTVVLGQVIHFMSPDQVGKGLHKAYRWLKPSGQLFLMANTIYGIQFGHLRELLSNQIRKAKLAALNEQKSKNLIFPTYLPTLGVFPKDRKSTMQHPHDLDLTSLNLGRVGFEVTEKVSFSTGCNPLTGALAVIEVPNGENHYFYIGARKPFDYEKILEDALAEFDQEAVAPRPSLPSLPPLTVEQDRILDEALEEFFRDSSQ